MENSEQINTIKAQISRDFRHDTDLLKKNLLSKDFRIRGRVKEYLQEIFKGDEELERQVGVEIRGNGSVILYPD